MIDAGGAPMSIEDNKELVRRFIDEVMNTGNTAAIADFCVPGSRFAGGIDGQIKVMKTGFPDNHFIIEEMLAEGDKVAVQATIHGTNNGPMLGLPKKDSCGAQPPHNPVGQSRSACAMEFHLGAACRSYASIDTC